MALPPVLPSVLARVRYAVYAAQWDLRQFPLDSETSISHVFHTGDVSLPITTSLAQSASSQATPQQLAPQQPTPQQPHQPAPPQPVLVLPDQASPFGGA